jgi:DNA-binding NarL/FixJ family response regulator
MQHVLIVGDGTLLDQGVTSLLSAEPDLEVFSLIYHTEAELTQFILVFQPEVIVISETPGFPTATIVEAIKRLAPASKRMVIVVRPDSNIMEVSNQITALQSEDLLRWIRSERVIRTGYDELN